MAKQIEREVGALLIYDKVLQQAVCPERRRGLDGTVSALASVTDVQISNDLQVAKVFLSIYSDDLGKEAAILGLQKLEGYVRKHVGRQVRLRLTPEIRFVIDDSIERTERVMKLLEQVKQIEAGEAPLPPVTIADDDKGTAGENENAWSMQSGAVDLGFYDIDDDEDLQGEEEDFSSSLAANSEDGDINVTDEEVEEMMAMFGRQQEGKDRSGRSRGRRQG